MTIQPIETRYAGCRFRSRLEARWAVVFDHLSIVWEYEAQGYELPSGLRYLPDFWLPDQQVHIEVKGSEDAFLAEAPRYAEAIQTSALPGYELIILGPIPHPDHRHYPYALARDTDDRGRDVLCLHVVDLGSQTPFDIVAPPQSGKRPNAFPTGCTDVQSYIIGEPPPLSRLPHSTSWIHGQAKADIPNAPRLQQAYTTARSARFEHGQSG